MDHLSRRQDERLSVFFAESGGGEKVFVGEPSITWGTMLPQEE
jgi:hypothetical protein